MDTHAIVWWFSGNLRLPATARRAIADLSNDKFVSAASAWEIAIKYRLGKMPSVTALMDDFRSRIAGDGFDELPITVSHSLRAGSLPGPHRDPFDRMLIAQAISDDLVLVSNETAFDRYGVQGCGDNHPEFDCALRLKRWNRMQCQQRNTLPWHDNFSATLIANMRLAIFFRRLKNYGAPHRTLQSLRCIAEAFALRNTPQ